MFARRVETKRTETELKHTANISAERVCYVRYVYAQPMKRMDSQSGLL